MSTSDEARNAFKPRSVGRRSAPLQRVPRFRQFVLARAEQRFSRLAGFAGGRPKVMPRSAGPAADVPAPGPGSRRCIVKARIIPLHGRKLAGARLHLAYIVRDGVEQDGSPGRLYAAVAGDVREALAEERRAEEHQFRFIVSPEDGQQLDLTTFARELMAQVERDTGRRLIWGAVNHHDTDNPHVHIVVRGVDARGAELRIERAYISERMRWRAQHLLTRELGRRTDFDITRQLDREVGQERFTTLDRRLSEVMSRDGSVDLRRLALTTERDARGRFVGRLETLTQLGLATKPNAASWHLLDGWQAALRALGERSDVIKRMNAALGRQGNPGQFSVVDGTTEQAPIEGIVRRKALHDELKGDMYAVVETLAGRAHYVRLDGEAATALREGQVVRMEVTRERWAKRMDHVIETVARESQGSYDPIRHRAALAARRVSIAGEKIEAEAVVAANVRRLERLERYRIVSRRQDGTFCVPTNLVALLGERERSHPRFRTKVALVAESPLAEVRHLRPTWLDSHRVLDPTRAGYGFGAEVAAAVRAREAFLARLGITGSPEDRRAALEQRARVSLGNEIARALGGTFLADPPAGFRGRAMPCESPLGDGRLVQIIDESNRRVALLAAADLPSGCEGEVIELGRDKSGRVVAERPGLSRGD